MSLFKQAILGSGRKEIDMVNIQEKHLPINKESRPGTKIKQPKFISIHWTGSQVNQTADDVWNWWKKENGIYGSAHYIIDHKGTIINAVPIGEVTYTVGSRSSSYTDFAINYFGKNNKGNLICGDYDSPNNYQVASIECIAVDSNGNYTDATLQAREDLVVYLVKKYNLNIFTDVLMHSHIRKISEKVCPKLEASDPSKWMEFIWSVYQRV